MNIYIELVKKWLADPASVTRQELYDNRDAAYATYATYATAYAAYTAYTIRAADYAIKAAAYDAAYCVKRYEELKEQE